jgi:hypothetical protein
MQAEEEVQCRQFGREKLHRIQILFKVPFVERYATDEQKVHVLVVGLRDSQLIQC